MFIGDDLAGGEGSWTVVSQTDRMKLESNMNGEEFIYFLLKAVVCVCVSMRVMVRQTFFLPAGKALTNINCLPSAGGDLHLEMPRSPRSLSQLPVGGGGEIAWDGKC